MQPPHLKQIPKQTQNLKQMQRLIMSHEMQQALHFLELPIMELLPLIEAELEQNPILESENDEIEWENNPEEIEEPLNEELNFENQDSKIMDQLDEELSSHFKESGTEERRQTLEDEKLKNYLDSLICQKSTLFDHLMGQAREILDSPLELKIAEALIGNFDDHGFLNTPLQEIALLNGFDEKLLKPILEKIKTLDPKGVGAFNCRESLLIQLKLANKENSLSYKIIENYYDELLHNRIPLIMKSLKISEPMIAKALQEIAKLELNPISSFTSETTQTIIPDITIKEEEGEFVIFVNEDPLPPLKLNPRYLKLLESKTLLPETKDFIEKKIASAKWMLKNLTERNETLVKIAHVLVKKQKNFLKEKDGKLLPMTMLEIASELQLHESTITRAVLNKYINTPKGLLSLRSFFTHGFVHSDGSDISAKSVKNLVAEIIRNENKKKPFSDATISKLIEAKGIPCARRTIAKYRYELKLGSAKARKEFI